MIFFYSEKPGQKRLLRKLAILWTFAIVLLCFLPAREVPEMAIPFVDKWVHFILFGLFSFLWLASVTIFRVYHLFIAFVMAVLFGWLVEVLQGLLTFLGRSQDDMDTLADAFGGLLGVISFYTGYVIFQKKRKTKSI
ncbi:MAG TPA: VanZ family protein [Flavipsychrobacter sp.]|nr:VanZ family protein [Flavipsychrobacter sp.]